MFRWFWKGKGLRTETPVKRLVILVKGTSAWTRGMEREKNAVQRLDQGMSLNMERVFEELGAVCMFWVRRMPSETFKMRIQTNQPTKNRKMNRF